MGQIGDSSHKLSATMHGADYVEIGGESMPFQLATGQRLRTRLGELRVLKRLGGGTQGDVYEVVYNGRNMALKWYKRDVFLNRADFIRNLQRNIDNRAPTSEFLWPIDMSEVGGDGHFGYVMDLIPEGYLEAGDLFIHPELFSSFKRMVDACMNIVHAFMILHNAGYVYRDISGGNFFINPQTGKVLICDNDNVAPSNADTGIRGTPRFMAPEVVVTNGNPSSRSDLHSLAVIIFYLLLMQHPLEGRRADMLDAEMQKRLYGTEPLFIFDENDQSNALDPHSQNNAMKMWPLLPQHMRSLFLRAFSQEALCNGVGRPTEIEWVRELTRLRSEIVKCPHCGESEVFVENGQSVRCDNPRCGAIVRPHLAADLSLMGYTLPVVDDMRIYKCQTALVCNHTEALDPLLWVIETEDRRGVVMLNIGTEAWSVSLNGYTFPVRPNQAQSPMARDGMRLLLGQETIDIRSTK